MGTWFRKRTGEFEEFYKASLIEGEISHKNLDLNKTKFAAQGSKIHSQFIAVYIAA